MNDKNTKTPSGWRSFFLIFFGLAAFFISPLPEFLISLIPDSIVRSAISPIYQDIVLSENAGTITKPQKYMDTKPLPVLGRNTGLCFVFNDQKIERKIIAEIIAIDMTGKELALDDVILYEPESENKAIICHNFSRKYSLLPDQIKAVYIRPISPITPNKIKWSTVKTLR